MARRIRAHAWEKTPLGPIAAWPETLVFAVNMLLANSRPMLLMWGRDILQIYNDAFVPILTDRHPNALGQAGRELWRDVWPTVGQQLESVLKEGRTFSHEEALVPVLRNGVLQDCFFDYTYSPLFDEGQPVAVLVICEEVTERLRATRERAQAEEALRLRQEELNKTVRALHAERSRLLNIVQQAPVLFCVLEGPQHRFTMANTIYRKLVSNRDLVGKTVAEALPEAVEQGYLETLDRVFTTGEPYVAQAAKFLIAPYEGQAPEERVLNFVYQPLREDDGTISGIIVIGVDITDAKRAENALIQTEKLAAVGRLASTIAHEINNPLEAVTNLLYLARTTNFIGEAQEFLEMADQELRRMSAIATQTLRFNRQSSEARSVTCTELISSVLNIYQGRIRNAGVQVEKRKRANRPVVCFDGEIRQVLNNLVSNAIDAMQKSGGSLFLRSREATGWRTGRRGLALTIADTGTGISHEQQPRIFEAFFTTKGASGTGLGLWVSKEIIARHKGALRVRSSQDPAHRGTVFTIFLPFDER